MDNLDSLKAKLNAQGYRFTPQRQLIFQVFQTLPTGHHLSAESLHLLLVERGERMSLSTVYRNLKIMTRIGILYSLFVTPSGVTHQIHSATLELPGQRSHFPYASYRSQYAFIGGRWL
ncbi:MULTISPECIES: Fur family transcriptional regulator [Fischerella]|uniref:Fur family transcriptional regulator n=1 Tax=Fischerella TaxID=1190 RepID=UPI00031CAFA3|nr:MULTISPECIES: transcriptional repressor [Fischerella]